MPQSLLSLAPAFRSLVPCLTALATLFAIACPSDAAEKKAAKQPLPAKAETADKAAVPGAPGVARVRLLVWCEGTPDSGKFPLEVRFTADPIESIAGAKYTWDFGDGSPSVKGQTAKHTYKKAGKYTATCRVSDADGHTGEDKVRTDVVAGPAKSKKK